MKTIGKNMIKEAELNNIVGLVCFPENAPDYLLIHHENGGIHLNLTHN